MKISIRARRGICVLLFVLLGPCLAAIAADSRQPMIGDSAPTFALKSVDAKTVSLEQHRGKLLVLHFAASW